MTKSEVDEDILSYPTFNITSLLIAWKNLMKHNWEIPQLTSNVFVEESAEDVTVTSRIKTNRVIFFDEILQPSPVHL